MFWKIIRKLKQKYNIKVIYEVGDCFGVDISWLRAVVKKKPKDLNVDFWIYTRPDLVNQKSAFLFKKMGVKLVYLGLESGSGVLLKNANKHCNTSDIVNSIKVLEKFNINIIGTYVLGLPGENKKTLNQTIEFTEEILKFKNIYSIGGSLIFPYIGSKAYKDLIATNLGKKFINDDDPCSFGLQKEYIKSFCGVSIKKIKLAQDLIHSMSPGPPIKREEK